MGVSTSIFIFTSHIWILSRRPCATLLRMCTQQCLLPFFTLLLMPSKQFDRTCKSHGIKFQFCFAWWCLPLCNCHHSWAVEHFLHLGPGRYPARNRVPFGPWIRPVIWFWMWLFTCDSLGQMPLLIIWHTKCTVKLVVLINFPRGFWKNWKVIRCKSFSVLILKIENWRVSLDYVR